MTRPVINKEVRDTVTKLCSFADGINLPLHDDAKLGCGCRWSVDHEKKPAASSKNGRATIKEFWFVLPDPKKGSKLVWLQSIDFGADSEATEKDKEELDKMQPSYCQFQYAVINGLIETAKKRMA